MWSISPGVSVYAICDIMLGSLIISCARGCGGVCVGGCGGACVGGCGGVCV